MLRELELDAVARLYAGHVETRPQVHPPSRASGAAMAPVAAPRVARAVLAEALRPGTPPWMVVGWPESLDGHAGRLLDAMLAAVGRRRGSEAGASDAGSNARLVLVLGDCAHDSPLERVALPDPRHLIDHPAAKAAAWEALARARRMAGG